MRLYSSFIFFILTLSAGELSGQPLQRFDSIFSGLYAKGKFNGNVLIAEKGVIVFQKSYGLADENTGEKLKDQSVFELASVSKQFTAMGIMILKESGKLFLEDSIGKYLPALQFYGNVTVRNLLHHTGGLPDYMTPVIDAVLPVKKIARNKDIISVLAKNKIPAVFAPGKKYEYSNTGYALLASVIEKVSGMSYGKFLEKNIFKPLNMNNSLVYTRRLMPRKIKNYAYGYVWSDSLKKYVLPDNEKGTDMVIWLDGIVGDGTVNASAPDLLKWDRALYTNQLLSPAGMKELFTKGSLLNKKNIQYGMGWIIDSSKIYGQVVSHSGGWPGYMTYIGRDTDHDKTIIILQNHDGIPYSASVIRKLLYNLPVTPVKETARAIQLSKEKLESYIGEYELQPEKIIKVFLEENQLKAQLTGQASVHLFAEAEDKFFLKVVSAEIVFLRDASGKVNKLILQQGGNSPEAIKIK
ncbi:MAG: serine hydrolase [Ferruginibacter sp.]